MAKAKTSKSTSTAAKTKTTKSAAKKTVKTSVEVSKAKKNKVEVQEESTDVSIEQKLIALYTLQQIDSQVDKIRIIRGELPLEVQDLEDEIVGLETRLENYRQGIESYEKSIGEKKQAIKESETLIARYKDQQMNVRNNREYDSLTKEIEFQVLEIQLSEKRINEFTVSFEATKTDVEDAENSLSERKNDLEIKKGELDDIVAETEKEEERLVDKSDGNEKFIEERLLKAYKRIRKNARNGLAVVQIERDACGGCFSKIPPQRHLDIRMHKKIIVCEYCGRILVDSSIAEEVTY